MPNSNQPHHPQTSNEPRKDPGMGHQPKGGQRGGEHERQAGSQQSGREQQGREPQGTPQRGDDKNKNR